MMERTRLMTKRKPIKPISPTVNLPTVFGRCSRLESGGCTSNCGTGSDVWKRIAAPMVGGIFTSFVLELVVYPAIYEIWKWHFEMKRGEAKSQTLALADTAVAGGCA